MITLENFVSVFPDATDAEALVQQLNTTMDEYGIDTIARQASFLAQCGHESAGWSRFEENLNYSPQGLQRVFRKYFKTLGVANQYGKKPEEIANRVYANRMGNGDEASGDGWLFRGRGPIQLTGKANYLAFATEMFDDPDSIMSTPDWVATPEYGVLSAVWFWNRNDLNTYADDNDIAGQTKIINGGDNGLDERIALFDALVPLISAPETEI